MKKIQTLDLQVKRWWDKVNGNSYFSARLILDYGIKTEKTFFIPFQYGYGNFPEQKSLELLKEKGYVKPEKYSMWDFTKSENVIYRFIDHGFTLQKEVKHFGEGN